MSKIKLKTDGKHYNELIEKKEEQLTELVPLEEDEDQADKAYELAYSKAMRQYTTVDMKDICCS